MNNLKRGLIALGLLFVFTGCGSGGTTDSQEPAANPTESWEIEQNGTKTVITFEYEDDKVLKQTTESEINFEEAGLTKEQFETVSEQAEKDYKGVEGLKHSIEFKDKVAVEHLEIDYSKVDIEEIQNLTGTQSDDADAEDGVSLKKTTDMLKEVGYKKVEK